MLIVAGDG